MGPFYQFRAGNLSIPSRVATLQSDSIFTHGPSSYQHSAYSVIINSTDGCRYIVCDDWMIDCTTKCGERSVAARSLTDLVTDAWD
jgi:hypothetical protein